MVSTYLYVYTLFIVIISMTSSAFLLVHRMSAPTAPSEGSHRQSKAVGIYCDQPSDGQPFAWCAHRHLVWEVCTFWSSPRFLGHVHLHQVWMQPFSAATRSPISKQVGGPKHTQSITKGQKSKPRHQNIVKSWVPHIQSKACQWLWKCLLLRQHLHPKDFASEPNLDNKKNI